jgi:haloacetate dehalogenase
MLSEFENVSVKIGPIDFNVYHAGQGEPLLLLHGYPQTAYAWWRIAPRLSERFHVVVPDLPGYGQSRIEDIDTFDFSKRNMGNLMLELVAQMEDAKRISVVGHDRGAQVAFRMGLDHPEKINRLSMLGTLPTIDIVESTNHHSAFRAYHWYFLSQPFPLPETLIEDNVDFFIRHTINQWSGNIESIGEEVLSHYVKAFAEPSVIRALCEDYRAGFSSDLQHEADRPVCTTNGIR